jgi:hypothetical protein
MRNIILGGLGAAWGAAILIAKLAGGNTSPGGAYGAGQSAALIVAVLLLVVGIRAIRKGTQERRS